MDLALTAVITALLVSALAGGITYLRSALNSRRQEAARAAAEQQIRRADARSREILLEAKEEGNKTNGLNEDEVNNNQNLCSRCQSVIRNE